MSAYDILKELKSENGTFLNPLNKKKKTTFMDYEPGKVLKKETWSKPENKKNESVKDDFLEGFDFYEDEKSPFSSIRDKLSDSASFIGSIIKSKPEPRYTPPVQMPTFSTPSSLRNTDDLNNRFSEIWREPHHYEDAPKITNLPLRPGNKLTSVKYSQPDEFIEGFNYYDDERLTAVKKNFANISKAVGENAGDISSGQEFHTPPTWFYTKEETNNPIERAGREYGMSALEDIFNYGWKYALAKEHVSDYSSPIYNSRYRQALLDSYIDNAKADYIAGLGSVGKFVYDVYSNSDDYDSEIDADDTLPKQTTKTKKTKPMFYVLGLLKTIAEGGLNDIGDTYEYLSQNNARANQSDGVLSYLENNDYKYLVDEPKAREKFIQKLEEEVEKIEKTETIGYLPKSDVAIYRKEMLDLFNRMIYLNSNYDYYGKVRDEEIKEIMKNY